MSKYTATVSQPTNLHDAIQQGNIDAIQYYLQSGYDINTTNDTKLTPLLLAICSNIDDDISNEIVKILIDHGANINTTNGGLSPLIYAVFNEKSELVEILLKAEVDFYDGRILHVAAERGNKTIMELLLNYHKCTPESINSVDDNGRTPAYIAASKGHKDCLELLIKYGANLNTIGDYNVVDVIFEEIPQPEQFFVDLLDRCITEKKTSECLRFKSRQDKQYSADFSVLMPRNHRQMDVISNIITTATDEEKVEILSHPLIELYLHLKWSKMCYFFYLWIFTYVLFVSSMSIYVALITHNYENLENLRNFVRYVMIATSLGLQGHAILQCLLTHRRHLQKYEMWLNLTCTTLALCAAFAQPSTTTTKWNLQNMPNWILHVTSITVLFAWTELMLLIGRLPTYGYYALMFSAVLQNVIRVLLTFICLVVGFALSFSIQFYSYEQFANPWRALVKTTVMMMGEFEYADLFANNNTHLSVISRVLFLSFIILTSIVLMNLMIGLAVSDIQSLQKESHARKLEKQIDFLNQLEKVITSKQLNSNYIPYFIKRLFRKSCIDTIWDFNTSTQFRRSKKIPNKLIDSLVTIAKSHRSNN